MTTTDFRYEKPRFPDSIQDQSGVNFFWEECMCVRLFLCVYVCVVHEEYTGISCSKKLGPEFLQCFVVVEYFY